VKQSLFGKEIIHLSNIDSTNNFAAKLLSENLCQNGAVILADQQTQGKGQRGNVWLSESGKNLLCSFVFKPDNLSVGKQTSLTWATSLSLLETLRKFNIEAQIKWPNDIYVSGKKIAGILIENQLQGSSIHCSIIGIGLNVKQENFEGLNATSLFNEIKESHPPRSVLNLLMKVMSEKFELINFNKLDQLKNSYEANLYLKNQPTTFEDKAGIFTGKIIGTTNEGKLLIDKETGVTEYGLKEIRVMGY